MPQPYQWLATTLITLYQCLHPRSPLLAEGQPRHCTSPCLAVIVNLLCLDQMVPTDWWTEYPAKAGWKRYISHERLMKGRACCTS